MKFKQIALCLFFLGIIFSFAGCNIDVPTNINSQWQANFAGTDYSWSGNWPDDFVPTSSNPGEATYDASGTNPEIDLKNGNSNHIEFYLKFNAPVSVGTYTMGGLNEFLVSPPFNIGSSMGLWFASYSTAVVPNDYLVTVNITSIDSRLVKGNFSGTVVAITSSNCYTNQVSGSFEAAVI